MPDRVLIVDDDEAFCVWAGTALRGHGFDVYERHDAATARAALDGEDFDLVLADLQLGDDDGIALSAWVKSRHPNVPIVVVTAHGSLEIAVAALRVGAHDFILKPFDDDTLVQTLARTLASARLREEVHRLARPEPSPPNKSSGASADLLGASPQMRAVSELVRRAGPTDASVIIVGESGTGKELVARALHACSRAATGPFVAVNCTAVPEHLLESELFGHTRGAFTDARQSRAGLFAQASGGTLFLDEIGDMPLGLQPKLLRALQDRVVRPIGADREQPFDARIIAATNANIEVALAERRFREDLFFRIAVITIELPPLRARGGDVLLLAQAFLEQFARKADKPVGGISPAAAQALLDYDWPGNVRELMNCIERAVTLTDHDQLLPRDLPSRVRRGVPSSAPKRALPDNQLLPLRTVERDHIRHVLDSVGGNKSLAAKVLGLDRKTLLRKLKTHIA
ncbi:MAG: sigma-54 dependent transcriptional regulator [Polyangiaceae bacterium]